ncbi:TATA-binding protein-associated factor mot1 [Coemansia sp. RSA 1822]|nr:TATA-binding protein-associated factor mot1 [Coemansia sp. RSA 638]KAJ2565154.1 TATA-binding protein-associated factor mot1 [Coemansia sp. RSA 1822]
MATRLDRLVGLLDSGGTPAVRSTAARQIGGIQRQHPDELPSLLARVYEHLRSKSWDTRIAAAQAFEAIAKQVAEWDPAKGAIDTMEPDWLTFAQFNVESVVRHGRVLLASAGHEFEDDGLAGLDPQARVAAQQAQMRKRLGMGAQFLDDDLLDDVDVKPSDTPIKSEKPSDTASDGTSGQADVRVGAKRKAEAAPDEAEIDMSKLSARERNRLKRKARMDSKKKTKAPVANDTKNGVAKAEPVANDKDAVKSEAVVVASKDDSDKETDKSHVFTVDTGAWAFASVVDALEVDLFDAVWEVRHGAAMALREILKHHGFGAGRVSGALDNASRNQRRIEDICVRLACVLTLDRFGDFVSDHVVAPVRETCAQALGVASQFLAPSGVAALQEAMLQLARGTAWERRHAGLSGLRYVVAVRRDLAALLVGGTLDAALHGLAAADDDVRAVAAATLLPLVEPLVTCQPHRVPDVVAGVWAALAALDDDLAASVAGVMDLLARLFAQPEVRNSTSHTPEMVPRLFPFFRHALAGVRRAVVQALQTFAEMADPVAKNETSSESPPANGAGKGASWISSECLWLVLQNLVLETDTGILESSAKLWHALLKRVHVDTVLNPSDIEQMFALAATPLGTALPPALLRRSGSASSRHNVDAAMAQQDLGLLSRETVLQCRVAAGVALGRLCALWPAQTRAQAFGSVLERGLKSGWALQTQLAAVIVEECAMAERIEASGSAGTVSSLAPMVWSGEFSEPAMASRLRDAVLEVVGSASSFHDMRGAMQHAHAECHGLHEIAGVRDALPEPFTLAAAQYAIGAGFEPVLLSAGKTAKTALLERRSRAQAAVDTCAALEQQYVVAVRASAAGAAIALGQLPAKLNALLRAVMAAVRSEDSAVLQMRAGMAAARMAALCYCVEGPSRASAADKMVGNLAALVCADAWTTPVFADRKQSDAILMLEVVQHEQSDAQMATVAAAAVAAKKGKSKSNGKSNGKSSNDSAVAEQPKTDKSAQVAVRGAEGALAALAQLFGAQLLEKVPRLWACVSDALAAVYGADSGSDHEKSAECDETVLVAADALFASDAAQAQAVIDALRVLQALAPAVDSALHVRLISALRWVCAGAASQFAAVRHVAARALAAVAGVADAQAMLVVVRVVVPMLRDASHVHRRQGAAEAVYYAVQRLGAHVLPYVPFLMVPVLGRMSDSDEATRLVCTNCFAQLLALVPLEADIPDPAGFPADLVAQRAHERQFLAQLLDPTRLEPYRIPARINATLRTYQQEGVDWLAFLNKYELHGVLCDDMGLGKTLQTICIMASDHHERREAKRPRLPSLVVCPPTLIGHWEQELRRYTDALEPLAYAGAPGERRPLVARIAANAADVVVMSYDVVRNDIELLSSQHWNYCVLDEGHVIKNARTKLTQAVKRLQARRRLVLSGTPVQNNVQELWSLFDFLMPGFLGSERQFNELYGRPIQQSRDAKHMSQAQTAGETALKALHKQVLPFLLRRMKEDVLKDLPPKIIQDYYCELSPLQKFLYEEFARSSVPGSLRKSLGLEGDDSESDSEKSNEPAKKATHVFQALQYLRKLCNHPALVLTPKHPLYEQVTSDLQARNADLHSLDIAPKLQALRDLLHECGIGSSDSDEASARHRVLIFCQHRAMIERIEQDLFARTMPDVTYMRVDGTVEARRRHEIVTQFNADASIDCLLLTTHVGGLGLNLTGADTVIFVEHDYNPAMDLQAMDRAHRLGQTRVVNVYRLITRNTLEEKIMGLQAFKLHMANTIVNQQNAGLSSMNTDQLLDLFNVAPPADKAKTKSDNVKSQAKAVEGLEELWDASQYEDEYNLDQFIQSLDP